MKKILLFSTLLFGVTYIYAEATIEQALKEYQAGNYKNALAISKKVLKSDLKTFGKTDIIIAQNYNIIGMILDDRKEYKLSIDYSLKALNIAKIKQDIETMEVSYSNLATTYINIKEYNKALSNYKKVLKYRENPSFHKHDLRWRSSVLIGQTYEKLQQYNEAEKYFRKALTQTTSNVNLIPILDLISQLSEKSKNYKLGIDALKVLRKIAKGYSMPSEIIEDYNSRILNFENKIKNEGNK